MSLKQQQDWYEHQQKIHIAVDCIIFGFYEGKLKLLVFKRKIEPLSGKWSLLGSFVKSTEDVKSAAERVLYELTGLEKVYLKELKSYSDINRDPGQRCISIAHYALINAEGQDAKTAKDHSAQWFTIKELPELVLDHNIMAQEALDALKKEARYQPIGFELLPDLFTIPQLQALYEAIYDKTLDSRNFRKKVISFNFLIKTDEKDHSSSKKGAYLYRFDEYRYRELVASGYDFTL
ncbi:NUDIX hydrolase [Flavimarina sp. Hel_I_48]|uniref:NUDIX hydrolase n=1 Tax=Flavimarina sp. Hel_I_48 TaxID=1392488 RepID=UPI0004DF089F|nr:NUDIX domain-containing protein [Flavimarina sp. Hel_I_48]